MVQTQVPAPPIAARPARFGALAWTALILGIVGVVGSPIIFLNNLTAVAAGVGVILGVIALFGTRKVLAALGVALCVGGIAFTVGAQNAAVEELDRVFSGETSSHSDATYQFGQTHKGERMAVTMGRPKVFTTSEWAMPEGNAVAFRMKVAVKNISDTPVSLVELSFSASIDGKAAEEVFDSSSGLEGMLSAPDVLPGRTATFPVAFLDVEDGELIVQVDHLSGDSIHFVGKR